jgi:hypothetical protein
MEINGTTYNDNTPAALIDVLERARFTRSRVRVFYGNVATGRDYCEEYDTTGYICRSTGTVKIPLLVNNRRSMGGPAILDHCIVKIVDTRTRETLYIHPSYHMPALTTEHIHTTGKNTYNVLADGELHASFSTLDAAARFIAYMRGERFNK